MTESNPFGGEGGLDMNALLQQAQQMQEQMVKAQEELAERTVDGTVGYGLVTVTLNGTGELVGVGIKRGSFDPDEPEDLEDLEDEDDDEFEDEYEDDEIEERATVRA